MKNQKGFTLIEMMISLAIATIGALAMMTMTLNSLKAQVNVNSLSDWQNLQDRIKVLSNNTTLCPQIIGNLNTTQINLAGEIVGQGIRMSSGNLVTQLHVAIIAPTGNLREYTTYLTLDGTKNQSSLGPSSLKTMQIPLTISVDASNNVIACSLTPPPPNNPQVNCANLGGVWQQNGNSSNWKCNLN